MIFSLLSTPNRDDGFDAFDPDHDRDLIIAMNNARTDEEIARATRMARSRFDARAKAQPRTRAARRRRRLSLSRGER